MFKALCINFFVLWSICQNSSFIDFKNGSEYFMREAVYNPFDEISATEFDFKKLSRSSEVTIFYFFLHFLFFDDVHFQYSQVIVIFLFSKPSDFFSIWNFYSFRYLSFPLFLLLVLCGITY